MSCPLALVPTGGDMRDSIWTVRNVNDLTRRSFDVLAKRIGLNEADFLQLLLVEYATSKVLCTPSDRDKAIGRTEPAEDERQPISLQPRDRQIDGEEPTSEEIADWIRRLDSKKQQKTVLQLSNNPFRAWLAGAYQEQLIGSA
jgi:hypothetical protein